MKTLRDIWQAHLDDEVTEQDLKALTWHLEHDKDPQDAISITTDMGLRRLAPVMAKHLDHEDNFIRQLTIGCLLGQLSLSEYTNKGFEMAKKDVQQVKNIATFRLGRGLNKIPFELAQEVANYLFDTFQYEKDRNIKESAYYAILEAMDVPDDQQPPITLEDIDESQIDPNILAEFCKKYKVNTKQA